MKKKKEKIPEEIRERNLFYIKKLLLSDNYKQDLKEIDDLIEKDAPNVDYNKAVKEFQKKHSIHPYYTIEKLQEIEKALIENDIEKFLELFFHYDPDVDLVPKSKHDSSSYLKFQVKPDAPRYIIHFLIDEYLNRYELTRPKSQKKKFRKEQFLALEIWKEWQKLNLPSRRAFPEIASKLRISVSTVKTRWYKAHEIILGKPYDLNEMKGIKEELKRAARGKADKLCAKCNDPKCYREKEGELEQIPCPEYLKLAYKGSLRERIMPYSKLMGFSDYLESKKYKHLDEY